MTIEQVIHSLIREKQERIPSRFPCRAVMVRTIAEYSRLLAALKKIPDTEVISAAALFSSPDIMPRYENLTAPAYQNRWLILPGISEYLRLFSGSEAESQRFARLWRHQNPASSLGRILLPLWGCEAQWHDRALHLCEDIRQESFYYDCTGDSGEEQMFQMVVLSGEFEQDLQKMEAQEGQILVGLREWYESWCEVKNLDCFRQILLTKRFSSIQNTSGSISVRVIRDRLAFLRDGLRDAQVLTGENCPPEAQALLFDHALRGETLDAAILSALNVAVFSGVDIMSRWETLGTGGRQLAVLWMKLHPDESYLCRCIRASSRVEELPDHILHDIFACYGTHPDWIAESQNLLSAMGTPRDVAYYTAVEQMTDYAGRLRFLSGKERGDRVYLLRMIGKWLREDPEQVSTSREIPAVYPALSAYLDESVYDRELAGYFARYKSHKLANTLPEDEERYFSGFRTDGYDYRYTKLSASVTEDCMVLWIDALGAEWLPLLLWTLRQSEKMTVREAAAVQAVLPTETAFNAQWKQMNVPCQKLNRLDKLAHKGVVDDPDYYVCVEEQFSFLAGIRKTVEELLDRYDRVLITGDHGTSRLAARFFHRRDGIPAPAGAVVCSHGRYCAVPEGVSAVLPNLLTVRDPGGGKYAVFQNYDHFTQSGFAAGSDDENAVYGEVHGGASPEELLVPLIVVDNAKPRPLTASWGETTVKIRSRRAKAALKFNRPVHNLKAKAGAVEGICTPTEDANVWRVVFQEISPSVYNVSIAADGVLVQTDSLTILPALGGGEGDLP